MSSCLAGVHAAASSLLISLPGCVSSKCVLIEYVHPTYEHSSVHSLVQELLALKHKGLGASERVKQQAEALEYNVGELREAAHAMNPELFGIRPRPLPRPMDPRLP